MNARARTALAAALAVVIAAASANAYNDDPDAEGVFPSWNCAEPVAPVFAFNSACIFYEVRPTGPHTAEIHFRNVANTTMHFDWWLPGRQRAGDNERLTLPPFFETKEETKRTIVVRHGRPGFTAAPLRTYDLRRGVDRGSATAPLEAVAEPPTPGEDFLPVASLRDAGVVRRSCLHARLAEPADAASISFRNPTDRDMHFHFALPALGSGAADPRRVSVPAHGEVSLPLRAGAATRPLTLLRVLVSDLRVGDDQGTLYAQDRTDDAGWFPPAIAAGSASVPGGDLVATVESADEGRARIRFRNHLGSAVRLRFLLPGYQDPARENEAVTVPASGEAEALVPLDRAADARLALTRLRAWDVEIRE